jgi:hypothetical protein
MKRSFYTTQTLTPINIKTLPHAVVIDALLPKPGSTAKAPSPQTQQQQGAPAKRKL